VKGVHTHLLVVRSGSVEYGNGAKFRNCAYTHRPTDGRRAISCCWSSIHCCQAISVVPGTNDILLLGGRTKPYWSQQPRQGYGGVSGILVVARCCHLFGEWTMSSQHSQEQRITQIVVDEKENEQCRETTETIDNRKPTLQETVKNSGGRRRRLGV
jgi:hypothetical protein